MMRVSGAPVVDQIFNSKLQAMITIPPELFQDVATYLTFRDCLNLKQCSKTLRGALVLPKALKWNLFKPYVEHLKQRHGFRQLPPLDFHLLGSDCSLESFAYLASDYRLWPELVLLTKDFLRIVPPNHFGNVLIRAAAREGSEELVALLLSLPQVDPTASFHQAFTEASECGHVAIVNILLKDGRVNAATKLNYGIRMAARHGHIEVVETLLKIPYVRQGPMEEAYHIARVNGHEDIVSLLAGSVPTAA
ncbi:hypothetical protein HDV03_004648 [Kappamyces sp. JEL0829]|nr:hypothetical protein HDV03_004648 [Kappamyces sp. JEL0829]